MRDGAISGRVIVDWDDTLILTSSGRRMLLVETIRSLGASADETAAISAWGVPFPQLVEAISPGFSFQLLLPHYLDAMAANPPILAVGAREFLSLLHQLDMCISVFTSSIRVLVELDAKMLGIRNLIANIWSSDSASHFKPDPRSLSDFLSSADDVNGLNCVCYVGDSISDFRVAAGNGIRFVAVTTGSTSRHEFIQYGVEDEAIFASLADVAKAWSRLI